MITCGVVMRPAFAFCVIVIILHQADMTTVYFARVATAFVLNDVEQVAYSLSGVDVMCFELFDDFRSPTFNLVRVTAGIVPCE